MTNPFSRTTLIALIGVAAVSLAVAVALTFFGNDLRGSQSAGVDGLLVVDLPPEESDELDLPLQRHHLLRVPLLAPTTSVERAAAICARGGGFAYYVALTGVTGAGHLDAAEVLRRTGELRPSLKGLPLAVGFGIKDAAGARAVAQSADAVVVGTALVAAIAAASDAASRKNAVKTLISSLKSALTEPAGAAG